jgi:mRNA interferase MazF
MSKGDIVLFPFPFTDLSDSKLRPAVVLVASDYDIVVAFITSQLKWSISNTISLASSNENGLKVDSFLRLDKLATIDRMLVVGKLGRLNQSELFILDKGLIKMLAIKLN